MSDVEEVNNAQVEYTEGDDEFINHQSIISADRASRMANMIASGVIDPDSGNKVYFENKPALEVEQFQPEPEVKIEEQPSALAQNEIEEPNNEQEHKEKGEKQEEVEDRQKIQTLQTQLIQSSQANRLGDEILQESHEQANQGDFKWNSGFNSKTSRKDSQNSHPSQQLQVIPSHHISDIEQENPTFQKSHNFHEEDHKIEQLKPINNEVADHYEVVDEKEAIQTSLVQQIAEQQREKAEQIEKEHERVIQIIDNNAVSVKSNIMEQQKGHEEAIPAQIQYSQQRVSPNKHHQHQQQREVNLDSVEQKVAEHHAERQVVHEAHEPQRIQQQVVLQGQNIRIKDNNLPSAVLSQEIPMPSQEAPVQKENKPQKTHHTKQNPLYDNKQNHQLPSSKVVHTYQQIQHDKQEKKATSEAPRQNERPPSIKRESLHIYSVRQKPPTEQPLKKSKDNCSCEIM